MAKKKEPDKLAQDAAKALAAGMSYGRWKAMQPQAKPKENDSLVGMYAFYCERCGARVLRKDRRFGKYCSDCQYKAHYEKQRERLLRINGKS